MLRRVKNYDVFEISDFKDSINRKRVEDNIKTNKFKIILSG